MIKKRMTERNFLECLQSVLDWKFEKTGDHWYEKLSVQVEKKLKERRYNGN